MQRYGLFSKYKVFSVIFLFKLIPLAKTDKVRLCVDSKKQVGEKRN